MADQGGIRLVGCRSVCGLWLRQRPIRLYTCSLCGTIQVLYVCAFEYTVVVITEYCVMMAASTVSRVSTDSDNTPESEKRAARVQKLPQQLPLIRFLFWLNLLHIYNRLISFFHSQSTKVNTTQKERKKHTYICMSSKLEM